MSRCIYCLSDFESASEEHILQNSLGARWTSDTISCDACQKEFGDTVDVAVGETFAWLRNLFDIDSGRRKRAATIKKLPTPSGRAVNLEPGAVPRLNQPHIEIEELSAEKAVGHISAGNRQQLEWGMKLLQDRFPGAKLDRASLLSTQRTVSAPLGEPVELNVKIGGVEYSRGILKSCFNLYAACFPEAARKECFTPLRDFVLRAKGDVSEFHRWPAVADCLPRTSDLEHRMAIVRRGRSVEGIVSLFGYVTQVVRLCDQYDGEEAQACSYLVDPLREREPAEERDFVFDENQVLRFADQPPWLQAENNAILAANLQEPGAVLWRRGVTERLFERFKALQEQYRPYQPLSLQLRDEMRRAWEKAVSEEVESGMQRADVSERPE